MQSVPKMTLIFQIILSIFKYSNIFRPILIYFPIFMKMIGNIHSQLFLHVFETFEE